MNPLVTFLIRLLETLFAIGWIGSLLAIVISLVDTAEAIMVPDPPATFNEEKTLPPTSE